MSGPDELMRGSPRRAAECLLARYRNEPWFFSAKKAGKEVELRVTSECPFREHRPVLGIKVLVVARVAARNDNVLKAVELKAEEPEPPKRQPPRADVGDVVRQMKKDRRLLKIAGDFRDGVLGPSSSAGACFMVAAPLASYLTTAHRIECKIVSYDFGFTNHYLIKLDDGRVLDPTADQFAEHGATLPAVYLGEMPKIYLRWIAFAAKKAKSA